MTRVTYHERLTTSPDDIDWSYIDRTPFASETMRAQKGKPELSKGHYRNDKGQTRLRLMTSTAHPGSCAKTGMSLSICEIKVFMTSRRENDKRRTVLRGEVWGGEV